MPVVAATVADFCERPMANALGIGVSITTMRGLGRSAWTHSRSIIAHNQSPDVPFAQSINPYRGCEHGCVYCFARPTHTYMGMSAGLDFESKLFVKPDAPLLLEKELAAPNYSPKIIAIGTNTDPYQPIER